MFDKLVVNLMMFFLLCFLIVKPTSLIAQEFENLGRKEGLSSQQCYSVIQDRNGFTWIATQVGIDRYDGESVVNYTYPVEGSIFHNSGFKLRVDIDGNLWLFNDQGFIYSFNEGRNKFVLKFNLQKLLPKKCRLFDLFIHEHIWFCTNKGLWTLDPVTQKVSEEISFQNRKVEQLTPYIEDCLLVTTPEVLLSYNTQKGITDTILHIAEYGLDNRIRSVAMDKITACVWIGMQLGDVLVYDSSLGSILNIKDNHPYFPKVPVNKIIPSINNEVFVGSDGGGVFKFDSRDYVILDHFRENVDVTSSLKGNGVRDMHMSNSGNLLVATYTGGLNILARSKKNFEIIKHAINNKNSLRNNVVNSILEDVDGDMWFATNNGVSCWKKNTNEWVHFLDDSRRIANAFLTIFQYDKNTVMAGSYGKGAYIISKSKGVLQHIVPAKNSKNAKDNSSYISEIYRDNDNKIWTGGTFNDLAIFNPKSNKYKFLPIKNVRIIKAKDKDHIFVASSINIFIVNIYTLEYEQIDFNGKLLNVLINTLSVDSIKDKLWIGTSGHGLLKWDIKSRTTEIINDSNEISSKYIFAILWQTENILWASSEKGLIRYDTESGVNENYSIKSGLYDDAFQKNSAYKTRAGEYYFGSYDGVTFFNPENIIKQVEKTNIFFEGISISNKKVYPRSKKSPLKYPLNQTEELLLKYNQNSFSIKFTSVVPPNSSKVKYSWKLVGQDEKWTIPSFNKMVNYTNLGKGKYRFNLRAIGNRFNEIVDERTIDIIVKPAPWNTLLAKILFTFLFAGIVIIVFRFYRLSDKKRLSEAKIQFFTNTAHDIKTPLTLASAPLGDLMNSKRLNKQDRYLLGLSLSNLSNLTESVNQLLDFQKSDKGKNQLILSQVDLVKLIKNKLAYYKQVAESKGIAFEGVIKDDELIEWVDVTKIEKIIDNLLSNAFKYTKKGDKVNVILDSDSDNWTILVKDTGIGIPQSAQKNMFKRYYRGENAINSKVTGAGIGLLLTKNYVLLHKGKITFSSTENVGSEFVVSFITGKEQYGKEVIFIDQTTNLVAEKFKNEPLNKIPNQSKDSKKLKLLIVEDNDHLRNYLHNAMVEFYHTSSAEDGQIAIDMIQKTMPDIIVSDIGMPNVNGIELANDIKSNFETSHIPIILLTAYNDKKDVLKGLQSGADDYITKPFDTSILLARIENMLENRQKLRDRFIGYVENKVEKVSYSDKRDQEFIEKAIAFVEKNRMNPDLDKKLFAREMYVSTTLLYQKLKGLTGQSPSEFIKIIRLKYAVGLLKENQYSIGEIANLSGFSDSKYFSTCFKKFYGKTPRQFLG